MFALPHQGESVMDLQWWREFSKCRDLTTQQVDKIFFIGRGGSAKPARQFCDGCTVRRECLHYAILYDEKGIWAGTTELEREGLFYLKDLIKAEAQAEGTLENRQFRFPPFVDVDEIPKPVPVVDLLAELQAASQLLQLQVPLLA